MNEFWWVVVLALAVTTIAVSAGFLYGMYLIVNDLILTWD
jgi:hypothetical protein